MKKKILVAYLFTRFDQEESINVFKKNYLKFSSGYDHDLLICFKMLDEKKIEYIKKNYSIALMIDQRVSEGEKINFFNKMAYTTTLPAQLALKYNLSIIPVFIKRNDNNNFRIEFYNEIKSSEYNNKIKLTEKLNNVLESMIAKNPNQWIWTHNRWR